MSKWKSIAAAAVLGTLVGCEGQEPAANASVSNSAPASAATAEPDYAEISVEMPLKQVSEHVWFADGEDGTATEFEGFISNAGVIITAEGVVIYDALGTPALAYALRERIREITDQPIRKVIVGHYHADHIYGLQVFKDLDGAEIIGPSGAEAYINSDAAVSRLQERQVSLFPWVDENTRIVEPDRYVAEREEFELGGVTFVIDHAGAAHSDGDLTLLVETDGVLFSGDIIFEGRVPFLGDADSAAWLAALEQMEQAEVAVLVPGHGPVATDPQEAISLTRRYLAYVREHMQAAVAEFTPFDEAYAATDWSEFEHLPAFEETNRGNAYNVYIGLEAELLGS